MTAVVLFAKAPRPGYVKTRLAASVGADRAAAIYRDLGARVARQVARRFPLTVWYDPPNAEDEMRSWLGAHRYVAQVAGDLGARLAHAFRWHFARGEGPVIAIGADAPAVDASVIDAARRHLERADVVLGPATDGGYYLLGLSGYHDAPFAGVPWGTDRVMGVTLDRLAAADLRVVTLPEQRDVDTAADLAPFGIPLS